MEPSMWVLLAATWAGVTVCRVGGYAVGRLLPEGSATREVLDALPACALAAVLGPQIIQMDAAGIAAVGLGVALFLWRNDLLLGFATGCAVLLTAAQLSG